MSKIESIISDNIMHFDGHVYDVDVEKMVKELKALVDAELIGDGKPQFLTKSKLKEQIAWCDGRESLRAEQRKILESL